MLTTFDLDEYVFAAIRAGASGFLLKDAEPEELLAAIRAVATGDAVVAPSATRRLLEQVADRLPGTMADPRLETLTEREHAVLLEVARGASNAEVGAAVHGRGDGEDARRAPAGQARRPRPRPARRLRVRAGSCESLVATGRDPGLMAPARAGSSTRRMMTFTALPFPGGRTSPPTSSSSRSLGPLADPDRPGFSMGMLGAATRSTCRLGERLLVGLSVVAEGAALLTLGSSGPGASASRAGSAHRRAAHPPMAVVVPPRWARSRSRVWGYAFRDFPVAATARVHRRRLAGPARRLLPAAVLWAPLLAAVTWAVLAPAPRAA